jgi:vitamin B12 transporter
MRYLIAILLCVSVTHAQELLDEVVVSDSRISKRRKNSGKAVVRITAKELNQNKGLSLAQILNQYAGIYISGTQQHPGQNLSYFIRGGNNRQVLVRIDGVVVSDPSQIEADFDLRLVALDQIASIEVVKGASSSLYGSGAATAVINITTKNEVHQKTKLTISQEWGSQNTQDQKLGNLSEVQKQFIQLQRKVGKVGLSTSLQRIVSDGMSSVVGTESDPVKKENIQLSTKSQYNGAWAWSAFFHRDVFDAHYDSTFPSLADADYSFLSKQQRVGFAPSYARDKSTIELQTSWLDTTRSYDDSFPASYTSAQFTSELTWHYRASDQLTLLSGFFYQDITSAFTNDFSSENYSHENLAFFASANWQHPKGYALQLSARNTMHSEFGSHQTFTVNPFYVLTSSSGEHLKVFASWATSFIAPSQYKLFSALYGNTNLEPEENQTFELGFEQVSDTHRITLVGFQREEDNFIGFVSLPNFAGQYRNQFGIAKVRGVELEANWRQNAWDINANYTFTEKLNQTSLRIPKHTANLGFRYLAPKAQWGLHWRYVGARFDLNPASYVQEELEAYQLVDARVAFPNFIGNTTASLSVTNLFDVRYAEIIGFTTLGRNLNLSVHYAF